MDEGDELLKAVEAVAAAEGALRRAAKMYPARGSCAIRAVIDVERGNLKQSRQHILSAAQAKGTPHV